MIPQKKKPDSENRTVSLEIDSDLKTIKPQNTGHDSRLTHKMNALEFSMPSSIKVAFSYHEKMVKFVRPYPIFYQVHIRAD